MSEQEKSAESRATDVTFFEDRARVHRTSTVVVEAGVTAVDVTGVSALIDQTGLVVTLGPDASQQASIRAAQVQHRLESSDDGDQAREALAIEEEEARKEVKNAQAIRDRLYEEKESILELETSLLNQLRRVPQGDEISPKSWRDALEALGEPLAEVRSKLGEARRQVHRAEQVWARVKERLRAAQQKSPEMVASVEVQIEAAEAGEVELVLEYFVPCALWRPSHRARYLPGDEPRLEMTTLATVWQQTGERWENIRAYFSTARLTKPSSAPLLEDDLLISRQKSSEERKSIQVEVRDQMIAEMADGSRRSVDEMPGIDDGGRPLTFEAQREVTIESDGSPLQVKCAATTLDVKVESLVYPELMDAPHLVVKGVWSAATPLLAGPVTLIRGGEFAGRTRQDFVAVGEPLVLGFGPQNAVRLQRRVDESRGQAKITGRQWIEKKIHLYASNLSGKEQRFEIVERVPVSEISEINVTVDGGKYRTDKDGFIRFAIVLGPRETCEESLGYRVEFGSKVELAL